MIGNPAANAGDTGSHPWSGKIPRAAEQLELCATTTEARSLNRAPQRETPVHFYISVSVDLGPFESCDQFDIAYF